MSMQTINEGQSPQTACFCEHDMDGPGDGLRGPNIVVAIGQPKMQTSCLWSQAMISTLPIRCARRRRVKGSQAEYNPELRGGHFIMIVAPPLAQPCRL